MDILRRRLAVWLAAMSSLPSMAAPEARVMKVASPVMGDASNEWMRQFKLAMEKRSPGQIRVELYPSNQLGSIPATVEGVALGTIEMTIPAAGFLTGIEPRFNVLDVPGLFDDVEHAQRVFADSSVRRLLADFGRTKGIEPLFVYAASPLLLLTRKPVASLDDLRGLKIRAAGGPALQVEPLRRLGATPVSMTLGETMAAIQNKALDGMVSGIAVFTGFKYYDVARYLTVLPGSVLVVVGLVSRRFMTSLGADLERTLREESRRAEESLHRLGADDIRRLEDEWREHGGQIKHLPATEADRYLSVIRSVLDPMLRADSALSADYTALRTAAQRLRQ